MSPALYRLSWLALLPFARLRLWWRARAQPAYAEHVGERFGRYSQAASAALAAPVWVHAVSVGEVRAAAGILQGLIEQSHGVVLTVTTPTGRAAAQEMFSAALAAQQLALVYSPYDAEQVVGRFLAHFSPCLCVLMETEIWPTQLALLQARGTPVVLANARMSEKSASAYAARGAWFRSAFGSLRLVLAQSDADAQRLRALGANPVEVTGNLKFDNTPDPALMAQGLAWRATAGAARHVLLASTTREGEEALILAACQPWLEKGGALLVLVPRHPQRFDEVAALAGQTGLCMVRRSLGLPDPQTQVWLGDSMGEMAAYVAMSDLVLMGGSLLRFGAHNLIEALAQGKPVLIGPHTYNFAEATARGIEAGAVIQQDTAAELITRVQELLADAAGCAAMGAAGRAMVAQNAGATARTLAALDRLLAARA